MKTTLIFQKIDQLTGTCAVINSSFFIILVFVAVSLFNAVNIYAHTRTYFCRIIATSSTLWYSFLLLSHCMKPQLVVTDQNIVKYHF